MRAGALAPQLRQAMSVGDEAACEFAILAIEELFAGKAKVSLHPSKSLLPLARTVLTFCMAGLLSFAP